MASISSSSSTPAIRWRLPRLTTRPAPMKLTFLDITASSEDRHTLFDVVARTAEHCFMPLTVRRRVRTLPTSGNSSSVGRTRCPSTRAAVEESRTSWPRRPTRFGDQCIVVSIDAKKGSGPGETDRWEIFTHGGPAADGNRRRSNLPARWQRAAPESSRHIHGSRRAKCGYDIALTRNHRRLRACSRHRLGRRRQSR